MTQNIVLYHGKCPDGIMAAWAAWRSLGSSATYIPCDYGAGKVSYGGSDTPPDFLNRDVYIVDFSFPKDVMLSMADQASHVTLLDHHKSAEADLKELIGVRFNMDIQFDMKRSGARMSYDYFQGKDHCWIVDYTQDRDLWTWALPYSKEINAYLITVPHDFNTITSVYEAGDFDARVKGQGCLAWIRYYVESIKPMARKVRFLGHDNIPVVNAPYTAVSEVVGELAVDNPFAVGWHQNAQGQIVYSLRSKGSVDVSEIAKGMGGGGHAPAAGFTCSKFPAELTEQPLPKS